MSGNPLRRIPPIALAGVVAVLVLGAGLVSYSLMSTNSSTVLNTTSSSQGSGSSTSSSGLYPVSFLQQGACSPPYYLAPWSVTLGGQTETEPANATVSATASVLQSNVAYSNITFWEPDGTYNYTVAPMGQLQPDSGSVTVAGFGLEVLINGPSMACSPTQASSSDPH